LQGETQSKKTSIATHQTQTQSNLMTYQNLLEILQTLTLEQLKSDVSIYDIANDEFYPMNSFHFSDQTTQVLDPDHPYVSF
jgi:dTDP-D-glucose 4,6-dehydratase